jgi:hypothetical protein
VDRDTLVSRTPTRAVVSLATEAGQNPIPSYWESWEVLTEGRRGWLGLLQGGGGLSGSSSASETCRKWILQRRVVVLIRDGLRASLKMAMTTGCYRENEGLGEIQIEERKEEMQRGSREG